MRRLDVQLLGRFAVSVDAHRVPAAAWEQRRAEDLVKLLALSPEHRLTRDEVVEALWPQLGAKAGVANLHKAAHYARKALGWPEAVVLRRGVVELAPGDRVETDVAGAHDAGDLPELLPDDRYEAWTAEHRERLAAARATALRRQGRWEELARDEPADEEVNRAVMRDLAAAGDRAAAARQFRRLRNALAALGLTPSEPTVSLFRELCRGEPVHAPTRPNEPMLGRNRELALARTALDATERGTGGALLILGDAGMGKTRLVDALLDDARSRDWHTGRGAGREEDGHPPYGPIVDAIEPLLITRADLLESLNEPLQRVLATLCPSAAAAETRVPADAQRHQVFAAVGQLLVAAARERGAVIVLEDLHASDAATLALSHYLARAARQERLLIVVTARHGEAVPEFSRVRAGLREQRAGIEIVLPPLPSSALARIARRVAGRSLPAATTEAIGVAAAGNPFFAEELAASIDDRGRVRVPEHIHDILDARLDRLPDDSRPVVLLAGALQDRFGASDLAAVAAIDRAGADAAVSAALRCGVFEREAAGLRFRHPLLREAARRRLDARQLLDAHERAAESLRMAGDAPEQVAYHLLAAGHGAEAVPLLTTAARRAAAVGAYPDGQHWVEQALEHAPAGDRGSLLELLGDLRQAVGDRRAARTYAAATDAAPSDRRTDLCIKHAQALNTAGDPAAGLEILRDLTATTGAQQARLALTRGMIAWYAGDLREARRQADEAASPLPDSERGQLADLQALIAHSAGTWEQHAEWQLAEVWHVPELAGRVFDAYLCVTEYVLHSGDPYTLLAEFAHRLREHAHATGARRGEAFATTVLGEVELLTGDAQAARTHLLEAVTLSRQVGAVGGEAVARARLGEAHLELGERPAARRQLDEALALAHTSSLADHLLPLIHGPLLRVPEDPAEALALVDRADALLEDDPSCTSCSADYYIAAATVCARAGHATRAHAFLARAEHAAGLWKGGPWTAAAAEARAVVLSADGDQDGATQALRRAIAGYSTAGQRRNESRARRTLSQRPAA